MRTRAMWKFVAETTALGARVPQAELIFIYGRVRSIRFAKRRYEIETDHRQQVIGKSVKRGRSGHDLRLSGSVHHRYQR